MQALRAYGGTVARARPSRPTSSNQKVPQTLSAQPLTTKLKSCSNVRKLVKWASQKDKSRILVGIRALMWAMWNYRKDVVFNKPALANARASSVVNVFMKLKYEFIDTKLFTCCDNKQKCAKTMQIFLVNKISHI
jgi:hypothetical protein